MWPWPNYCALMGTLIWNLGSCCDHPQYTCGARSPGDIMIGVLSPCHTKVESLQERIRPGRFNCTEFDLRSFVQTLAVIYTIDTINESGFLPGVRLGYVICDTCSHALKAVQSALHMLEPACDFEGGPLVKAIIGARYSEVSSAVARLLGLYMVPQISTTSSVTSLDDKLSFPSFLRTIPSDGHQTRALAQIMAHFNWDWVGVVSGDDSFGRFALQGFRRDAGDVQVCIAFSEVLPHYLDHAGIKQRIHEVADRIQSSKARVVLLVLRPELVEQLFEVMIVRRISRTWVACDSWSMSRPLASMKGINMVGDIFGISFIMGPNPGFDRFLTNLTQRPGAVNGFVDEYRRLRFGCSPEAQGHRDCLSRGPVALCPLPHSLRFKSRLACELPDPANANDDFLTRATDLGLTYSEKLATWAIAYALRDLLNCSQKSCPGERDFPPWKLLQELKRVRFTLDSREFFFDDSGNFANGYQLTHWARRGERRRIEVIGEYDAKRRVVTLTADSIDWETPNRTVPESSCSSPCGPGTFKKVSKIFCCYNCSQCEEGSYTNVSNLPDCLECPDGTWSLRGWSECRRRTEVYFHWNDPFALPLLVVTGIGFLLLICVLIVFLIGRQSAVFKVAGGELCFVMMAGLAVSFGGVVLFVGRPNNGICRSRQTMYGLGFTLSVSCILVKTLRTFLAFLMDGSQQHCLHKLYNPPAIIICSTAIQGLICLFWLIFDSPKVEKSTSRQSMSIVLTCSEGSNWGFGLMLSYIAVLAAICFILARKGRRVPQRFNETGYIIFSMVVYLFVWICFIPVYVTKIKQRSAVQASAIIVSNLGIIFCHFLPKCYMILCKRKEDISQKAYMNSVRAFSMEGALPDVSFDSEQSSTGSGSPHMGDSSVSIDSGVITQHFSSLSGTAVQQSNALGDAEILPPTGVRERPRAKSL